MPEIDRELRIPARRLSGGWMSFGQASPLGEVPAGVGRGSDMDLPDPDIDALLRSLRDLIVPAGETAAGRSSLGIDSIARTASDFIFVLTPDGRIDYINPSGSQFLGVAAEQLIGRTFSELSLLPDPSEAELLLAQVVAEEKGVTYERQLFVRQGKRHLQGSLSPLRDPDGALNGVLGIAKDVTDMASVIEELRSLSMIDELTGVFNRRGFTSLGTQQLSLAQRTDSSVCLVLADMDDLKVINDRFGHRQGDSALVALASILRGNSRRADLVARIGGDEFVIFAHAISPGGSRFLLDRLRQAIAIEDREAGRPYKFSATLGAVERSPGVPCTLDEMLAEADTAMYAAKRARKR